MSSTIKSDFTSHGREALGFYENTDKIISWRKQYEFPEGVEELFDTLNHQGYANTYCPDRAFYAAYVLTAEGYSAHVLTD